jgi:hypothetical protein
MTSRACANCGWPSALYMLNGEACCALCIELYISAAESHWLLGHHVAWRIEQEERKRLIKGELLP